MKVPWYSVFSFLILLFRSNGKNNTWMRTIFVTVMVTISKVTFWRLLDTSYFQSSLQLWGTFTTAFERHLTFEDFTDMNQHSYGLILSWIKNMKQKWTKKSWKLLVAQKSEPVLGRTLHQALHLLIFFFYSETSLVFKFNQVICLPFYSQFPNNRPPPPPIVNFLKFFYLGNFYSNPPFY